MPGRRGAEQPGNALRRAGLANVDLDPRPHPGERAIARYRVTMSERLRMTIAYDEPDEDGWIVARVVEVPGAISQGKTRREARDNVVDALRLMLSPG